MKIEILISIFALIIAAIASVAARDANHLTNKQILKNDRPWVSINKETIEEIGAEEYYIKGEIKNIFGGPALNISFKVGINGNLSELATSLAAILPSEVFNLTSHGIKGPKPKENDVLSWVIEFEDINHKKFRVTQEKLVRPQGLKDLKYIPEEL